MLKLTSRGLEESVIIELTDEDREEIVDMFSSFRDRTYPIRDKGDLVWRRDSDNEIRGKMS